MLAVPAGCIAECWPEREHQARRVNVDTEGSVEYLGCEPGLEQVGSAARTLGSLKICWIPSFPSGFTNLSFYFSKSSSILKLQLCGLDSGQEQ